MGALVLPAAAWLAVVTVAKPRLLLYLAFGLLPTQFLFIPLSDFFLSPGDVLVGACAFGLIVRLAALRPASWHAVYQHRFLVLMLGSYLAGFVLLGVFSRTIVRLPIAMALSVLASEQLRSRKHLMRAGTAIVLAGAIDAAYGLYFVMSGAPLHPSRFKGMSDVNYAAMLITTAAAIALAQLARTRRLTALMRPGALGATALATLSQMGVIAMIGAWVALLRRIVSRRNKIRIASAVVLAIAVALAAAPIRERILSRTAREVQADGVARNSADIRWLILETSWNGFQASPVLGIGYLQFARFSNTNPEIRKSTGGVGYPTHNSYVEVLVEGGIIGFLLFMMHWWQYVRQLPGAIRVVVRERDVAVAASLVGFPVIVVCAALANVLMVYSFWAVAGLALAGLNMLRREETRRTVTATGAAHGVP